MMGRPSVRPSHLSALSHMNCCDITQHLSFQEEHSFIVTFSVLLVTEKTNKHTKSGSTGDSIQILTARNSIHILHATVSTYLLHATVSRYLLHATVTRTACYSIQILTACCSIQILHAAVSRYLLHATVSRYCMLQYPDTYCTLQYSDTYCKLRQAAPMPCVFSDTLRGSVTKCLHCTHFASLILKSIKGSSHFIKPLLHFWPT